MVRPLPPRMTGPLKVAVLTGGHDFERKPFFEMFDSFKDVKWTEVQLKDHSEIFEDISNWDYDVIVLYNMTQNISPKRQDNFARLMQERGVGLVGLTVLFMIIKGMNAMKKSGRTTGKGR